MTRLSVILAIVLSIAVTAVYWNHFDNSFHFDDSHTVQLNPFIRHVSSIPRFFYDSGTFSSLVTHRVYRPLTSATLAIDYWLGGSLDPFYFHLSTFVWFNVQLVLMFLLFRRIFDDTARHRRNLFVAWGAVAFYGLHPVCAETVNYIIQRADVLSTLGIVASLCAYGVPFLRRSLLYLVPALLGLLAKQSALVFAPILFVYVLLFEQRASLLFWRDREAWGRALRVSVPAFILCVGFYFLQAAMGTTDLGGGTSVYQYAISQPFVMLHYFRSFFLPTHLSADTDWKTLGSLFDPRFYVGITFVLLLVGVAADCSRRAELRPITFSIAWFFLALLPTSSILPLAEVMNDHRMFFPFVGLALGMGWLVALLAMRFEHGPGRRAYVRAALAALFVLVLGVNSHATYVRNEVWDSEESLWYDVTLKSPLNGRGMMNYGRTQMAKGRFDRALQYFERALVLVPQYYVLQINLGVAKGALKRSAEAEGHFLAAIRLSPQTPDTYYYYARWLSESGRNQDAIEQLQRALSRHPRDMDCRHLLMRVYEQEGKWAALRELAQGTLQILPGDAMAKSSLEKTKDLGGP
jgi:protein O-mannosyl-transferase